MQMQVLYDDIIRYGLFDKKVIGLFFNALKSPRFERFVLLQCKQHLAIHK